MRYLFTFLAALAVIAGSYTAAIRVVDPRGSFETGVFPQIAFDWHKDKQRLFREFIKTHRVDGVILGSSKSMQISPKELNERTGKQFFNFGVDAARTSDFLAIYRWILQFGVKPKILYIGLDLECLQTSYVENASLQTNPELKAALEGQSRLGGIEGISVGLQKYKDIFATNYVVDAARAVSIKTRPASAPLPKGTFEPDGYLHYPVYEKQRADGTFSLDQEIRFDLEENKKARKLTGMASERKRYFETLLREARQNGTQVVVWLTGVHPVIEEFDSKFNGYREQLSATREYLDWIHREFAIPTFDLSEMATYGGTSTAWYNAGHVDEENARRILIYVTEHTK